MGKPLTAACAAVIAAALSSASLVAGGPASAEERAAPAVRHPVGGGEGQGGSRDFWTVERMRSAKPLEDYLEPSAAELPPGTGKPWPGPVGTVKTVGRLFLTLPGGQLASCSAAVVDSESGDVIVTAAHCAHLEETGGWAERMLFVPGYAEGRKPYGEFSARRASVSRGWSEREDADEDYAFIRLDPSPQGRVADVVGSQPVSFTRQPNRRTVALGYPATSPYDGESVQYCSGTARASIYPAHPDQQYLNPCFFTEGSSGGPWYADFDPATGRGVQTGVTSGKPVSAGGDAYVFGAMFDATAEQLYHAVDTG